MPKRAPYVKPPKSQIPRIQGLRDYVEKHFGHFDFKEVRYIRPGTSVYKSISEMQQKLGRLGEDEELGGCCGRLPTGEVVVYLVNRHKRGHGLPFDGLLYEMIHLAKPDLNPEDVEHKMEEHFDSALKHASVFAYNATHKRKKPYPK